MRTTEKPTQLPVSRFQLGLIGILLLSLGLRFWGLGRFNTLVFDEVYYAKFANNYLTQTPFFDGHPPLSKYLIAIGIWIGSRLPFGQDTVNTLTGSTLSTWSYRWLNALTGSLIPLVISAIAFQLSRRKRFALIAGFFAALDGLFLVESRYALNNVYLVLFGLLGQLFLLLALCPKRREIGNLFTQLLWLSLSGLSFAASFSIKWNGLWFMFGAFLLWVLAWILRLVSRSRYKPESDFKAQEPVATSPLYRLTQLNLLLLIFCFAVLPAIFYFLIWIPHLRLNPEFNFIQVQQQILGYHQRVGSGANVHPYCSTWYSWILMLRPVAYFYHVTGRVDDSIVPSFVAPNGTKIIYDVHAMGNPALWWLSSAAIVIVVWMLLENWRAIPALATSRLTTLRSTLPGRELWIGLFLLVNYIANLLPWMPVTRCVFLYHYMGCSVYASMMLAWLVDRWLRQENTKIGAICVIGLAIAAFIFWMPIYLGLPLTEQAYQMRMWFRSWI